MRRVSRPRPPARRLHWPFRLCGCRANDTRRDAGPPCDRQINSTPWKGDQMKFGKVQVDALVDGELRVDCQFEYPNLSNDAVQRQAQWLEDGAGVTNLGGYLVRTDD